MENSLGKIYEGSKANFMWLIEHLFGVYKINKKSPKPALIILDYLLLTVRAWANPKINKSLQLCRTYSLQNYSNLILQIDEVLKEIQTQCQTCQDTVYYACKLAELIKIEAEQSQNSELLQLLQLQANEFSQGTAEQLQELLRCKNPDNSDLIRVSTVGAKDVFTMSEQAITEAKQSTVMLRTKLQSLLQAQALAPTYNAGQGVLDTKRLYKLAIHNPKIFLQKGERKRINTAVHILLDCSASMSGRISLAIKACYALALALQSINGINVGVTAFPALDQRGEAKAVKPLLEHGKRVSNKFSLTANHTTPLADALWYVLQKMLKLKENRKIILILTDGEADSLPAAKLALAHAAKLGFELCGIGIMSKAINELLPNASTNINKIEDLAPTMFEILQKSLLKT